MDKALAERVAAHLAGRPVEVRFRQPVRVGALGQVYKMGGRAIVDLDPDLESEWMFRTFLHELGHVVKQWDLIPESTDAARAPRSLTKTNSKRLGEVVKRDVEGEADQLADEWLDYAAYKTAPFSTADERLETLLTWWPAEIREMINKAVKAATQNQKGKR